MSKPIVHAGKPLKLTAEQVDAAVSGGLKVALAYRDGRKRRIMKGSLRVYGCPCCGIFADVNGSLSSNRYVTFTNLFSLFHDKLTASHD